MGSSGRVFLEKPFPGEGVTPGVAPPPSCAPAPFPSLPCPLLFLRGAFFHLMKAKTLDIQPELPPVLAVELPVLFRDVVPCGGMGRGVGLSWSVDASKQA